MSNKIQGIVLLVLGVLLFLLSATADYLGVGGAAGFGWKQIVGVVIGVVIAAVGMVRLRKPPAA